MNKRRRVKDDCPSLTLKQIDALIARDGLGESCEYDLESLRVRRFEILEKKARVIKMPWQCDNGGNDSYPPVISSRIAKNGSTVPQVERSTSGGCIGMDLIEKALQDLNLDVKDLAGILGVTVQAISLWRNGHRSVPSPVIKLVMLMIDSPSLINKITCFNKADKRG